MLMWCVPGCPAADEALKVLHKAKAWDALKAEITRGSAEAADAWRESNGDRYLEGRFDEIESVDRLMDDLLVRSD